MPLSPVIATSLAGTVDLDPESEAPRYRLQVFRMADDFSPGPLVAELANPLNLGYGKYLNDVPELFVTMQQDDEQLARVMPHLGRCHYLLWRGKRVVHAGWLFETDESPDDVVLYGYGYMAGLYWMLSGWEDTYTAAAVSTIARAVWEAAKDADNSMLGWITTGSIEGAQNAVEGSGEIVLPDYRLFYKRSLFALQELASLGMSDTEQSVVFEITHAEQPVFNFWHNQGIRRPSLRLEYGGNIVGFNYSRSPVFRRNDVLAVGATPHDILAREQVADKADQRLLGLRQEPLFLAWVRDDTELERVAKFRSSQVKRDDFALSLRLAANSVVPTGGYGAGYELSDSLPVKIDRGTTQIDDYFQVVGEQVVFDGSEHVNLLMQEERRNTTGWEVVTLTARPLGGGTTPQTPKAIYYNGKTYYGWVAGDDGGIYAGSYDHATGVAHATKIATMGGDIDDHNNPAIMVRESDKRILVAYCGHGGPKMWLATSTNPEDISSFTIANLDSAIGTGNYTYPALVQLTGVTNDPIFLFYRHIDGVDQTLSFTKSTDGGSTWSAETKVFVGPGADITPYWCIAWDTTTIHVMTTDRDAYGSEGNVNIGHFYYNGTAGTYHKSNGTQITAALPFATSEMTPLESNLAAAFVMDGYLDGGVPVFTYVIDNDGLTVTGWFVRWDVSQGAWIKSDVMTIPHPPVDRFIGSLVINRATGTELFTCVKTATDESELDAYSTDDNGLTWYRSGSFTGGSGHINIFPQAVLNADPTLPVIWYYGSLTSSAVFDLGIKGLLRDG